MTDPVDPAAWVCPLPLRNHDRIVTGHGGGGQMSGELVEHLFIPAFGGSGATELHDSATIAPPLDGGRLAFSTDSFVVSPLFFAGGDIGRLAVNGTVNDLAMSGARPLALSAAFILGEGLELAVLAAVVESMGRAARTAGVEVATGDTKVVESAGDEVLYINTSGIGVVPPEVDIRPGRAAAGDAVLLSGPIGEHGIAVMSQRSGLEFGTGVQSDTAPLTGMVASILGVCADVHVLRDPTRGGLAGALCEIAAGAGVGIEFDEDSVPVPDEVAAACAFLGLDPTHVANEGKLVAIVPADAADDVLAAMRSRPEGEGAVRIGHVVADHPGVVAALTPLGALRVVDQPLGEQLPRIC